MDWRSELDPLFNPQSVAIVGASKEVNSRGHWVLQRLVNFGYKGRIFPVNPKYEEVAGFKCYHSIRDIPDETVDFAMIVLPARPSVRVLEECVDVGVRAGALIAAGFGEATNDAEGVELQRMVVELCERGKLRISGPNCLGIVNVGERFASYAGSDIPQDATAGKVAVITQSGALSIGLIQRLTERGIGFSHLVTTGNEAVLGTADYLAYLLERREAGVLALFVEGIKSSEKFLQSARKAMELRKPILILKAGRTARGAQAALSHTGSLAGSYAVFKGAMRQSGVIEVGSVNEFIENIALFSAVTPKSPLNNKGPAFVSQSGGATSLLNDFSEEFGLKLAELPESTKKELSRILPSAASAANPLDTTGFASQDFNLIPSCLKAMCESPTVGLLVYLTSDLNKNSSVGCGIIRRMVENQSELEKPTVILTETSGNADREVLDLLKHSAVLQGLEFGVKAVRNFFWYYCRSTSNMVAAPQPVSGGQEVIGDTVPLSKGFALLQSYGIPTARWRLVEDRSLLGAYAAELGYPVVIKPDSGSILHKSDVGLVGMGIRDEFSLRECYDLMVRKITTHTDETGVIMQETVDSGTEVFLGASEDSVFGSFVTFGLGGVFIEALKDYSIRLPPLTKGDATEMIGELHGRRLLQGERGTAVADLDELERILVSFSRLIRDNSQWIHEMDINPLIVTKKGLVAVDVRVLPKRRTKT